MHAHTHQAQADPQLKTVLWPKWPGAPAALGHWVALAGPISMAEQVLTHAKAACECRAKWQEKLYLHNFYLQGCC